MSASPKPPAAGPDSALTLEAEPLVFFHPTLAGLGPPGKIQPIPGSLPLEEEPATWAELGG